MIAYLSNPLFIFAVIILLVFTVEYRKRGDVIDVFFHMIRRELLMAYAFIFVALLIAKLIFELLTRI